VTRAVLAIAVVIGVAASVAPAQRPTFSAKVVSVQVDALVVDGKGIPLKGLRAGDFEVRDDGVPQKVELLAADQVPVNIVLALDMSGSVAGERLTELRAAARAVLSGLREDDRAALVTFSEVVTRGSPLTGDVNRLREIIDAARGSGRTALFDAAYAALVIGQSDVGRTLVILFSDGVDTSSWLEPEAVIAASKRSNAVTYAVAIGAASRLGFVRELTRGTGGSLYRIETNRDLRRAFVSILDQFRQRYLLSYTPHDVPREGWHRLEVRVRTRRAIVRAREGYFGGP
jgi:VWFA-related protein